MSSAKTKSNSSKNHLLDGSVAPHSNSQHAKPKRKAPAAPGGGVKSSKSSSGTKVKRKTSNSQDHGAGVKAGRRKAPQSPLREENEDEVKDNKLRRVVSPRKEQYSHLLDEMVGCGDMVLLEPLTEGNIIENLKKRYAAGDIYVSSFACSHFQNYFSLVNHIANNRGLD